MFGGMLCAVDGTMLAAGAAEIDAETAETAVHETFHMVVDHAVDMLEELLDLAFFLKVVYDRLIKSGEFLVLVVAARVAHATAVEDIASAIAAAILRDTFSIGEAADLDSETGVRVARR